MAGALVTKGIDIRVSRQDLAEALAKNREKHLARFEAATVAYKVKRLEVLHRLLAAAEADKEIDENALARLVEPESHVDAYDRVIRMMKVSVDDTLTLTEEQYRQYFDDEWSWYHHFDQVSSSYGC